MSTSSKHGFESPSHGSLLLPQLSRRDSTSSLLSLTALSRETVSHALDEIHSTASQSDSLTVFNDYTSPPSASNGVQDTKRLTGDFSGGLNSLYSRLRHSVSNVRDVVSSGVVHSANVASGGLGNLSGTQSASVNSARSASTGTDHGESPSPIHLDNEEAGDRSPTVQASFVKASSRQVSQHPFSAASVKIESRSDGVIERLANVKKAQYDGSTDLNRERVTDHENSPEKDTATDVPITHDMALAHSQHESAQALVAQHATSPITGSPKTTPSSLKLGHKHSPLITQTQQFPDSPRPDFASTDHDRFHSATVEKESQAKTVSSKFLRSTTVDAQSLKSSSGSAPRSRKSSGQLSTKPGSNLLDEHQHQKNRLLNKQFWMKDENAKDCFFCGNTFTTFRRKHHCRTCGQIFDAQCTTVISGARFGLNTSLRVCKPCEGIVHDQDDSSDFSDDSIVPISSRPRHGSIGAHDRSESPKPISVSSAAESSRPKSSAAPGFNLPMMSIPASTRNGEKSIRRSTIFEVNPTRSLVRPTSSNSSRGAALDGVTSLGHRRQASRTHSYRRGSTTGTDAPFHQGQPEKEKLETSTPLPNFHDDNIIDPDLALYLSDDATSGDEQVSIMDILQEGHASSHAGDKLQSQSGSKRLRSRLAGRDSISQSLYHAPDTDNQIPSGSRSINSARQGRRRGLSAASNQQYRSSPRSQRQNNWNLYGNLGLIEDNINPKIIDRPAERPNFSANPRMTRSSSMKGPSAPLLELNSASLEHVQKLLRQLLTDVEIPQVFDWEKVMIPLLLRATTAINPDVQSGDDMDIRNYIKFKKIAGGRSCDTSLVSGLVFSKNLALKSMARSLDRPTILILTFPLEYARHQQHFLSLEPVIRQEREFLQNLVHRISALRPHLVLAERHVSGLALEMLEQAGIAVACNIKRSVLEAVSRCCESRIVSSIDKLALTPASTGTCASFVVKTYRHNGRKKTFMFLSGCAPELGCTIVLRGADPAVLGKVKRLAKFMVYVVYNLRLETSLMRDEGAHVPSTLAAMAPTETTSPSPVPSRLQHWTFKEAQHEAARDGEDEGTISTSPRDIRKTGSSDHRPEDEEVLPENVPMPTFYTDMVEKHETKTLSASPFVRFNQPYLLTRAREQERRLAYLRQLKDQDLAQSHSDSINDGRMESFVLIKPEMVHNKYSTTSRKLREVLHAVHDAEYDKALHIYQTQTKQWESYIAANIYLFDPYAHQNIAVLYSVVYTPTATPCSGPEIVTLGFYDEHGISEQSESDCTLGQYVEDLCLGAEEICPSSGCDKRVLEHHRQYVHGEAQLSVFIERVPCKLPKLENKILMWSLCRHCGAETETAEMSANTWKYSFGKYLELSFWSSEMRSQSKECPHDLHKDHARYFGFMNVGIRIQFDRITLLEIIVPRARVTWKVDNDLIFKNDTFTKIEERIKAFMASVRARIKGINADSVLPEKMAGCAKEVERLTQLAKDDQQALISRLQDLYMTSKHYETVPLNRVLRSAQEKATEWDDIFSRFDEDFFPSEKDIRRLATLQLKKIFLERDEAKTSISPEEQIKSGVVGKASNEKIEIASSPLQMLPFKGFGATEKPHAMPDTAELDQKTSTEHGIAAQDAISPINDKIVVSEHINICDYQDRKEVEHLDLAGLESSMGVSDNMPTPTQTPSTPIRVAADVPTINAIDNSRRDQHLHAGPQAKTPTSASSLTATGIPKPLEGQSLGSLRVHTSPSLNRTLSQPAISSEQTLARCPSDTNDAVRKHHPDHGQNLSVPSVGAKAPSSGLHSDRRLSSRLGMNARKLSTINTQSMIPRSINSKRQDSRVSYLAKHFEQLSREFEKERLRERRQRAAMNRRSRAYPPQSSQPIVEIYNDMHEAVQERDVPDDEMISSRQSLADMSQGLATGDPSRVNSNDFDDTNFAEDTTAEQTEAEDATLESSCVPSDNEGDGDEASVEIEKDKVKSAPQLEDLNDQLNLKMEFPKHEKTSLMKMLSTFWAERSASGWQPLSYPLQPSDHIFADSDIIVREDEPSSLIALALGSDDYHNKLATSESASPMPTCEDQSADRVQCADDGQQTQPDIEASLLRVTGTHLKYQFAEGSAKMLCKIFYAEQFDAVRRQCGVSTRFVESLSRCMKWDSKGGKTKSVFLKTSDDRFVLKSLSTVETQAFLRFAPAYFRILSESLFHELPSVIAKMLGFYQIIIKNPVTGIDFNWFLLVMENLFYDRSPTRIFDLKGSMRNRRAQATGERDEVLLDENMVEFIYESPLFTREHSKKLLRASVWNDTLFLSRQNVMDYSLMIAIDESKKELVVGMIDCIRTYTWDKKLESWIKDRGKNRPTVTSPKEYKTRFREAMGRYVLQAPNCWHQFRLPGLGRPAWPDDTIGE